MVINIGDIFYSSWGYEQTNVDFYQVVKTTPKTVTVRAIKSAVSYNGEYMSGLRAPLKGQFDGPELRRRIHDINGSARFTGAMKCEWCRPWDGNPQAYTSYA